MKNILSILILSLITLSAFAVEPQLRSLIRVEKSSSGIKIFSPETGVNIPIIVPTDKLRNQMSKLNNGSHAIIQGEITYRPTGKDNQNILKPYFVIESLTPISLGDLAVKDLPKVSGPDFNITKTIPYARGSIPVTAEVASAITLTSGFLLMESLSSSSLDPSGKRDITKALFISAGTLATLLFIYEQIQGKTKL